MTRRKEKITLTCQQCGAEFQAWTRTGKYCDRCKKLRLAEQSREYQRLKRAAEKLERANLPAVPPPPKICQQCGQEFDPGKNRRRLYCDVCVKTRRREFERRQRQEQRERSSPKPEQKTCPVCGKKYRPAKMGQFYCSADCKHKVEDGEWSRVWEDRNPRITDAAVEAKKRGLSYGQYKALLMLKAEKEREAGR